jgi:hypothetical protein
VSYFNADQQDYMRSLGAVEPKHLCWCAWFPLGQCHSCPTDVTAADKLQARCPACHNDPGPDFARPVTHRRGCDRVLDALAIDLGLADLGGEA